MIRFADSDKTPTSVWPMLVGLGVLAAVDRARAAGLASDSVLVGSLPNLVAVPVLTFGFLPVFDSRSRPRPEFPDQRFLWIVAAVTLLVVAWEFLQPNGNLTFDRIDLLFTGFGSLTALMIHWLIGRRRRNSEEHAP